MISTILAIAGTILGGGSIWGLVMKLGGWLGWRWIGGAAASPILGTLSSLAEKLIDFVFWVVRGFLGYAAAWAVHSLDHISKDTKTAIFVGLVAWSAWAGGADRWKFWDRPAPSMTETSRPRPAPTPAAEPPTQLPDLFGRSAGRTAKNPKRGRPPRSCTIIDECWWSNIGSGR